MDQSMK